MATLPFAPADCNFDPRALFTHGEFPCFSSPNPCLQLFTHGEFPRPNVFQPIPGSPDGGQGAATGRWRQEQERWEKIFKQECEERIRCSNEEVIAIALLLSNLAEDEPDDWF